MKTRIALNVRTPGVIALACLSFPAVLHPGLPLYCTNTSSSSTSTYQLHARLRLRLRLQKHQLRVISVTRIYILDAFEQRQHSLEEFVNLWISPFPSSLLSSIHFYSCTCTSFATCPYTYTPPISSFYLPLMTFIYTISPYLNFFVTIYQHDILGWHFTLALGVCLEQRTGVNCFAHRSGRPSFVDTLHRRHIGKHTWMVSGVWLWTYPLED